MWKFLILPAALVFFGAQSSSGQTPRAEVFRFDRRLQSRVRPYAFLDDNYWESSDRSQRLPSQNRTLRNGDPNDPRDYLLRDRVERSNSLPNGRTVEEIISTLVLPQFASIMRADLGGGEAPLMLAQRAIQTVVQQLQRALSRIESDLAIQGQARNITFMIAPWEKMPVTRPASIQLWAKNSRYSPSQLGFNSRYQTPTRDWAAKNWIANEDGVYSFGQLTGLGNEIREAALTSTAIVLSDPYALQEHTVAPYAYPIALLVNLKIVPGQSEIKFQTLLGLQPMLQSLDPPQESAGARISNAGIPQPTGLTRDDSNVHYPLLLATYRHNLREPVNPTLLHIDFGIWEGYRHFEREMALSHIRNGWRMAPFLGGEFTRGNTRNYWTHISIPIRIHLTEFDVEIDSSTQAVSLRNTRSAIELFDTAPGRLIPFATRFNIGITDGQPVLDAARSIQEAINQKVAQSFADARQSSRQQALKKFPLAALFINNP